MGKKRLFVDMDGTVAKFHDQVNYLERMFEKDFFLELEPFENMVEAIRQFIHNHPDVEVFILSARVIGEPPYCEAEKNAWIERHLPEIDLEHRIYTDVGKSKAEYIPGGVSKDDFLLDDYNKGLNLWLFDGGSAIKCHNNINQKGLGAFGGSAGMLWCGDMVHTDDEPSVIAAELASHMGIHYDLNKVVSEAEEITYSEFKPGSRPDPDPYRSGSNLYLTHVLAGNYAGTCSPERFEATFVSEDKSYRHMQNFSNPLNAIRWLGGRGEFQEIKMCDSEGISDSIPFFQANALASNLYGLKDVSSLMNNGALPPDVTKDFREAIENAKKPIIGTIGYLGSTGLVGETAVYHSVSEMKKEIQECQNYGIPISEKWLIQPQFSQKEFILETDGINGVPEKFSISRDNLSLAVTACGLDVDDIDDYFNSYYSRTDAYEIWDSFMKHVDTVANLVDGFVARSDIETRFSDTMKRYNVTPVAAAAHILKEIRDWSCWCNVDAIKAGILKKALHLLSTTYSQDSTVPQPVKNSLNSLINMAADKRSTSGKGTTKPPSR